jgi:endonuclease/exonuclease/phosphatase family metal-dependent hydrolase
MASKFPIENKMAMQYDSNLQSTGVLYGEINGAQVACTHLSGDLNNVPYGGNHGSYDNQNLFEARMVLGLMKSFEDGRPQIILGDFNSGPAIPEAGIVEERPGTYERFLNKGWRSANALQENPFCTYCPEENGQIRDPHAQSQITSHIFVKGVNVMNPKRFWDFQNVHITEDGEELELFPSDHFAYRSTVTWPYVGDQYPLPGNDEFYYNASPLGAPRYPQGPPQAPPVAPAPEPAPVPAPEPAPQNN